MKARLIITDMTRMQEGRVCIAGYDSDGRCVGLARHWEKFPDRCYLQLTGIYTFPDYLGGKVFADLAPPAAA